MNGNQGQQQGQGQAARDYDAEEAEEEVVEGLLAIEMDCWHCSHSLIWGGDHDCEVDDEYDMVSNLSCPNCDAMVLVYLSFDKKDEVSHG